MHLLLFCSSTLHLKVGLVKLTEQKPDVQTNMWHHFQRSQTEKTPFSSFKGVYDILCFVHKIII